MVRALYCLVLIPGAALAWDSVLYPYDTASGAHRRATVALGGQQWTLPDISHAGYALGARPVGQGVPCRVFDVDSAPGQDIGPALQDAIHRAGQAGGGVVRLPAGDYRIDQSVAVPYDRVSIEGAGSALTRLHVPASYDQTHGDYDEGVFTIGRALDKWRQGWWNNTEVLASVTRAEAQGSMQLWVDDATGLDVGQWVVAVQYVWPGLAQRFSGPGDLAWPSVDGWPDAGSFDRRYAFVYLRRIVGMEGNRLTVDAPLPRALNPADNPVRLRNPEAPAWTALRAHSGVSGLSLHFADNRNGRDGRPGGTGVLIDSMRDAWVHDVHVHNFPRFGIRLTHAARVTVSDNAVVDMQDDGGSGFGYAYSAYASQNVLFARNHAEEVRRGFTATRAPTSVVVFSGNRSLATRALGDDTHHSPAQQVVFDQHRMGYGTGLAMMQRGPKSDRAYETAWGGVVWNASSDGRLGGWYGGGVLMNPMAGSQAFVVGVHGMPVFDMGPGTASGNPEAKHRIPPGRAPRLSPARSPVGPGSFDRNVFYEGIGQAGLTPTSLYASQLRARLGAEPPGFSGGCGRLPVRAAVQPRLRGQPGLIFDSDHLGSTALLGSGCLDCDVDAVARNATPGGHESARITLKPENWALGLRLRGAMLRSADVNSIGMQVYPTAPGLRFRVTIGTVTLDNTRVRGEGAERHVVIGPLDAGRWNRVDIPGGAHAPAHFNTLGISAIGPASAQPFYLDEVFAAPAE